MRSSRRKSSGVVLIELAIVIPVFLIILVGVINIASIIWQIQVVYEGTKYAARKAADYSLNSTTCENVRREATDHYNTYLDTYGHSMGVRMDVAWANPTACVDSITWDNYTYPYSQIKIMVNNAGASPKNCILCAFDLLSYINVSINRTFGLEALCTPTIADKCV